MRSLYTRSAPVLVLALSVALAACGSEGGGVSQLGPQQKAQVVPSAQMASVAAALAVPMQADTGTLHRDRATADQTEVHTRIEHAISGASVVTPPTCVMYNWNGLSVVITLTNCTLEQTGQTVSGTLGLTVTLVPTQVAVTLTNLTVNGSTPYTGSVTLRVSGADLMPSFTIDFDLTTGTAHFVGSLTIAMGSATLGGSGTITVGTTQTAVTLAGVSVTMGNCLPTAGTMTLAGPPMVIITFLPTTPTDGKVQVQVGSAPPSTQMVFPPCP